MKKFLFSLIAILAAFSFALPANAWTTDVMEGKVGNYKVKMQLTVSENSNKVTGWYYYVSKGAKNKIQLSGTQYGDGLEMETTLTEKVNGKVTGTFKGTLWTGYMSGIHTYGYFGTWTSPAGKRLSFDLTNL